jgi:hypothetical protein
MIMKRRDLLLAMGLATTALPLTGNAETTSDNDDEMVPGADAETELLFVQNADAFELGDGVLRLKNVSASTLYFSDRPEHLVGHWYTRDFLKNWSTGGDQSFAAIPPNAALSFFSSEQAEDMVVELKNPRMEGSDLLYDVALLEGEAQASGKGVALFIDTLGHPLSPGSVAGVHRRHRRRRRRRIAR